MPSPALQAADDSGLRYRVIRHGPVRSLAEAAQARRVTPADVIKTLVVRRGDGDFLFVLVPGDRTISWPRLRALLAVSRLSLPDAATAQDATGYERGTITPFGSLRRWPVIADARISGREITGAPRTGSAGNRPHDGEASISPLPGRASSRCGSGRLRSSIPGSARYLTIWPGL